METRLLTVDEVALMFNVSTSTVRRWIRSGKLEGQKAGAQWRFDPDAVREAFQQGALSGESRSLSRATMLSPHRDPPAFAKPIVARWRSGTKEQVRQFDPDHIIVNDRRGAKIWAIIMPGQYLWGHNLWHSTAVRMMPQATLKRMFAHRKVLLFDEIIQHGREMHELRELLEQAGAQVASFVCVRRRSHAESGELIEYQALACEDLDDKLFAHRAAMVSQLVHLFEPPLDVDHLIVSGTLDPSLTVEQLLENLANWGISFLVWPQDREHSFLAITLDRPQFFDTEGLDLPADLSLAWDGPCKVRFYVEPNTRECYCSFIVFPTIEAPVSDWIFLSDPGQRAKPTTLFPTPPTPSPEGIDEALLRRVYRTICMEFTLRMLQDFVLSGAADDIGIQLDRPRFVASLAHLRGTFGPSLGDRVAKRVRDVVRQGSRGERRLPVFAERPPDLFVRKDSLPALGASHVFKSRTDFLKAIPPRYRPGDSSGHPVRPISYSELLRQLSHYSESTIGRVLDYELDRGTVKPLIVLDHFSRNGVDSVKQSRGFCRGEFGVWFEFDRSAVSHHDVVIQRTLGLAPAAAEHFLSSTEGAEMTATQFNKVFTNLQHDWREGAHDLLYLGWRPYKYGPVPVAPVPSAGGEFTDFKRYLVDSGCLRETTESRGSQTRSKYAPADESQIPWRRLYGLRTTGVTRAHMAALMRLYAAIQQECKTVRPSDPRSPHLALFRDPLVALATARNEEIAYISCWFEVHDWRRQGQEVVFPLMGAIPLVMAQSTRPILQSHLERFAEPGRLLFDKIQMYRHLPYLRQQIVELMDRGTFEIAEILLETVDVHPRFQSHAPWPMANIEWACGIMRAFSSMTRQVLTACSLDVDTRKEKTDPEGRPKNAAYYLEELLDGCPEMRTLEGKLRACIAESQRGDLTEQMSDSLREAFNLILSVFETQHRIPDPRPHYEQARELLQIRDGMLSQVLSLPLPQPYAIAVADIRNLRNLPRYGEIFGISYDEALENLLAWVEQAVREVNRSHQDTVASGITADNVFLASPTADAALTAAIELTQRTFCRLAEVDRSQFAPFGLLRTGIAWRDDALGGCQQGVKPGMIAHTIGDNPKRQLGTIAVTEIVYNRLSMSNRDRFRVTSEECEQGKVFIRDWDAEKDLA